MKKMILTLVAVIAISSTALAQDQQGPRPERKFSKTEMAKHRTDEMAKEYKLSDKQAKQLQALNEKYAAEDAKVIEDRTSRSAKKATAKKAKA